MYDSFQDSSEKTVDDVQRVSLNRPNPANVARERSPSGQNSALVLPCRHTAEEKDGQKILVLDHWLIEADHDGAACAIVGCWERHLSCKRDASKAWKML